MQYIETFFSSIHGTFDWTIKSILFQIPWYKNYFWGLLLISAVVWIFEILFPWRKGQKIIRKDFWLDSFYMFFNFFLFSIAISGFYKVFQLFFYQLGIQEKSFTLIDITQWHQWVQGIVFFVVLDFVQWFTHILLHRIPFFWRFHKIHHSVKEMGFAAHLRYHWMENLFLQACKNFRSDDSRGL